jgi:hypothetical protein
MIRYTPGHCLVNLYNFYQSAYLSLYISPPHTSIYVLQQGPSHVIKVIEHLVPLHYN